jgi:hypothetical protein
MAKKKVKFGQHAGLHQDRFGREPEERQFAEHWAKLNEEGDLLWYLLHVEQHKAPRPLIIDRDAQVAATVIQWLGSHVGQCFLNDMGYFHLSQGFPEDR